jgi:hypothetical protein
MFEVLDFFRFLFRWRPSSISSARVLICAFLSCAIMVPEMRIVLALLAMNMLFHVLLFQQLVHLLLKVFHLGITLAGIAYISMCEIYVTMGESIYPIPSSLSTGFPEASGKLLRIQKEFTFQDMVN